MRLSSLIATTGPFTSDLIVSLLRMRARMGTRTLLLDYWALQESFVDIFIAISIPSVIQEA